MTGTGGIFALGWTAWTWQTALYFGFIGLSAPGKGRDTARHLNSPVNLLGLPG